MATASGLTDALGPSHPWLPELAFMVESGRKAELEAVEDTTGLGAGLCEAVADAANEGDWI